MADAKTPSPKNDKNRRSGLDRRWIIAPHEGPERRSGDDRRQMLKNGSLIVAENRCEIPPPGGAHRKNCSFPNWKLLCTIHRKNIVFGWTLIMEN